MPDREKVILGIENCLQTDSVTECSRIECPFIKCRETCLEWLLRSALALLKEQEPRVLTLEEVQNDCPDYVYLETAFGWIECCVKDEGDTAKSVGYFVYGFGEYSIKAWEKYGVTWRCWTAMPTDEQRKVVKWNDSD